MTLSKSIVHSMNDLISAVEILRLASKQELVICAGEHDEYAARMRNNDIKRALGQLKAARASLFMSSGYNSYEEINLRNYGQRYVSTELETNR